MMKLVTMHDSKSCAERLVGSTPTSGTMSYYRTSKISKDKKLRAYVIGLAIGDGNLSKYNERTVRLRITCDTKYPDLIKNITKSLQKLFPENRVSIVKRKSSYLDVSVHSNHLENLLGWKAKGGSKFSQNISVPSWVIENNEYKIKCLRGLIETDGSIYLDRGYKMVIFSTIIQNLGEDVHSMINSLGFECHFYKILERGRYKYQVRLSKNTQDFLNLIKPNKS